MRDLPLVDAPTMPKTTPATRSLPGLGSTCRACGDPVERADRGRPREFCDATCRSAWRRIVAECNTDPTPTCDLAIGQTRCAVRAYRRDRDLGVYTCRAHLPMFALIHDSIVSGEHTGRVSRSVRERWVSVPEWSPVDPATRVGTYVKGQHASWAW